MGKQINKFEVYKIYEKFKSVVNSCVTMEQLDNTERWINNVYCGNKNFIQPEIQEHGIQYWHEFHLFINAIKHDLKDIIDKKRSEIFTSSIIKTHNYINID